MVPIVQEAEWAPGPVWTGAEKLVTTGIRCPDRPARRQSLYRLSHRGPTVLQARQKIVFTSSHVRVIYVMLFNITFHYGNHNKVPMDLTPIEMNQTLQPRPWLCPRFVDPPQCAGFPYLQRYLFSSVFTDKFVCAFLISPKYLFLSWDHGGTVFKVLCYKSEGRWFDPSWCHWHFSLT